MAPSLDITCIGSINSQFKYFKFHFINMKSVILSTLVFNVLAQHYIDDLVAVVQVFRHGQRTPLSFFPNDHYKDKKYWSAETGELVNEGKIQLYKLGKFTRQRYNGFLPSKYNTKDFYAFTTDVDRTHMSAQSNIAGLYPPNGSQIWNHNLLWQPIPVHPAKENTLSLHCEDRSSLISHVLNKNSFFKDLNKKYANVYSYVSKKSGKQVTTASGVGLIYDTLHIEELDGYNVSDWHQVYPEPMRTISGYGFLSLTYTETLKKIGAGQFIHYLLNHFDTMVTNASSHRYKIYSGHDTNIASILNTIGAFEPHNPPFASSIYFELRNKNGHGYVNVWYKHGESMKQVKVKGCELHCPYKSFKKLLREYDIGSKEFEKLCKTDSHMFKALEEVEEFLNYRV